MAENQKALGETAYAQGRFSAAEAHARQELAIWHEFGNRAYLSLNSARLGAAVLATLVAQADNVERAADLLTLVRRVACSDRHTQTQAEHVLAEGVLCDYGAQILAQSANI